MEDKVLNRTGRWYLTIMNVTEDFNDDDLSSDKPISLDKVQNFTSNYTLRTWTSACYYYHEETKAWIGTGMQIRDNITDSQYPVTFCNSNHLTSFATGFFVIPNDIDFDFIFAHASFEDNLTIYICLIVTLILYIWTTMWAR